MWDRVKKTLPVLALAVAGLGVSIWIQAIHSRLSADVDYASFCNVNATINCDVVLSSPYASFLGWSVAAWAIVYYLVVIAFAAGAMVSARASGRQTVATSIFVLAIWGLLFSVYMALVAFAVLHTVCLMCSALYLVSIGLFVAAWRLRSVFRTMGRRHSGARPPQDRLVLLLSGAAVVALIAIGSWEAFGRGARAVDATDVARLRPQFYRWYFEQPLVADPPDGGRNSRGSQQAPVTIVEFSDFQCSHCAALHQSLDDVVHRMGGKVRVVFRHFPLDRSCNPNVPTHVHPSACLAAVAAECAGDQGKFWPYHNLLFANQDALSREFLIRYAERLGIDVARFTACLGSAEAQGRVRQDTEEGTRLGLDSTPTLFINGRTIKGALPPELLADAVILADSHHGSHPVE